MGYRRDGSWDSSDTHGDDPHELEAEYHWSRNESKAAGDTGDRSLVAERTQEMSAAQPGDHDRDVVDWYKDGGVSQEHAEKGQINQKVWQDKQERASLPYSMSRERLDGISNSKAAKQGLPGRTWPRLEIPGVAGEPHPGATSTIRGWPKNEGPRR